MVVTCKDCKREYDDVYHLTYCPHDYFEMHTQAVTSKGSKCCHSIEELEKFLDEQNNKIHN